MATDFDLTGRVAIVTGGNGGIGYGIAQGLAQAGANIVVAARQPAKNAQATANLQALGVPAHIVSSPMDYVSDPQLLARGQFVRLPHPQIGETVFESARYRLSETPARYERCAPHIGRDSEYVLRELLGWLPERIAALKETGALT